MGYRFLKVVFLLAGMTLSIPSAYSMEKEDSPQVPLLSQKLSDSVPREALWQNGKKSGNRIRWAPNAIFRDSQTKVTDMELEDVIYIEPINSSSYVQQIVYGNVKYVKDKEVLKHLKGQYALLIKCQPKYEQITEIMYEVLGKVFGQKGPIEKTKRSAEFNFYSPTLEPLVYFFFAFSEKDLILEQMITLLIEREATKKVIEEDKHLLY